MVGKKLDADYIFTDVPNILFEGLKIEEALVKQLKDILLSNKRVKKFITNI